MPSELYKYIEEHPNAVDVVSTKKTLKSCSKMFERGFLSHARVTDVNSLGLKNIEEGYTDWFDQILKKGMYNYCTIQ